MFLKPNGELYALEVNRNHPAGTFIGFYLHLLGLNPTQIVDKYAKLIQNLKKEQVEKNYVKNHPGHPGKMTLEEYKNIFQKCGFKCNDIKCLFVDLFPYPFYRSSKLLFNLMVLLSKFFLKFNKFNKIGAVLLIRAKKDY